MHSLTNIGDRDEYALLILCQISTVIDSFEINQFTLKNVYGA